jgi:hypothetical protein
MLKKRLVILAAVLVLGTSLFPQSRETGAIRGVVTDEQNAPLPGVSVTLSGTKLMGIRTFVTDANGEYRFPALPPGEYQLKAALPGFGTVVNEKIRLTTTVTLSLDIQMKAAAISEQVTVIAQSPTVDVKSTETASVTLNSEILRNIPYSQVTSDIVRMAPGVSNDDVAYGAQSGTGIAYSMDGVNVADPEGGTAWVFLDHNIIEEAKVMGVGLPAEYGNFTGVIFNLITKSGGNQFSGHFEVDFQGAKKPDGGAAWPGWLWGTTNNGKYLQDFPDLTSPGLQLFDGNVHLGGPIKKDKLWFYAGLQWRQRWSYETGYPETLGYKEPHSFLKLSSQLSGKTNMGVSLQVDTYLRTNRDGDAQHAAEATVNQTSPEVVGNFSLTHIFSPTTFFDIKAAGFWGYYYLEPKMGRDVSAHFFANDAPGMPGSANKYHGNDNYYYLADRARIQANASLTHYAEDFIQGSHDFKFGVEVEHSWNRSRYGYTGVNHSYYYDLWGVGPYGYTYDGNYLRYEYVGYDFNAQYTRAEAFAQDSWQVMKRLNINVGLRFSQNWGTVKNVSGVPFKTSRIAPRIGFTFDLLGDKTTILKAHYGQFTEAMLAAYHMRLSPEWSDYIKYYWDAGAETPDWQEFGRIVQNWKLDPNIKHPYMNQFTVSLERELFKDTSLSVAYIWRDWKNIIGVVDNLATYQATNFPVDVLDTTTNTVVTRDYPVWDLTSGDAHEFYITNVKEGTTPYVLDKPYRRYRGLEILFNKRFSNRWQLLASYVYSKTKGTIDNDWANDIGWNKRDSLILGDPNFWINADGKATFDPTHMIKIQGTYVLPFEINFNLYFRAVTGNAWTQRFRSSSSDFSQGRVTFFAEERGKYHYPMEKTLDMRLEKTFQLAGKYRLGVFFDVINVFNDHTIQDWGTRIGYDWNPSENDPEWPYAYSTQGHDLYSIPTPRQARLGIRLTF